MMKPISKISFCDRRLFDWERVIGNDRA